MISQIRILDDAPVVAARGPKFDRDRVIATLTALRERFAAAVAKAHGARAAIDEAGDLEAIVAAAERYDVCSLSLKSVVGPYVMRLMPFAGHALYGTPTSSLRTIEGSPASILDPSPCFQVYAGGTGPDFLLTGKQQDFVTTFLREEAARSQITFRTGGILSQCGPIAYGWLPAETFSSGYGDLRIEHIL